MKYSQLPPTICENGKVYYLESNEINDPFMKGWWYFKYAESNEFVFPAEVTDGNSVYFLISVEETKEKAKKSLLEKLNSATKILTDKDKKELEKKWEERKKKFKKNKK